MKYFIDCGANNSCSARIFRKLYDTDCEYHIFSFEIEPKFSKFFFLDIPNLTFIQKAVWIEDGTTKFYRDKKKMNAGGSILFEKTSKNLNKKKPIIVETIDFSKWIKEKFKKADYIVLKMDIEGAEYKVIARMLAEGTFEYINKLLIEWHWKKIGMTEEAHQQIAIQIPVPVEKWTGLENANEILGSDYIKKLKKRSS